MRKTIILFIVLILTMTFVSCDEIIKDGSGITDIADSESMQIEHVLDSSNIGEITAAPDHEHPAGNDSQNGDGLDTQESQVADTSIIATESHTDNTIIEPGIEFVRMEIYQYGDLDSVWGQASHASELDLTDKKYQDDTVAVQISLTVGTEKFDSKYDHTLESYLLESKIDYYIAEKNGEKIEIGLDRNTGKCVWFAGGNIPKSGCETEEGRYQVAYEFFMDNVDDSDQYQLTSALHVGTESSFRFVRVVSGLATNDFVSVFVSEYGIEMFKLSNIGYLKDAPDVSEKIKNQVCDNVNYRVAALFKHIADGYSYTQDTVIDRLVKTETGRYAVQCVSDISVINPDGQTVTTGARYLVYLDDNYDYEETTVDY